MAHLLSSPPVMRARRQLVRVLERQVERDAWWVRATDQVWTEERRYYRWGITVERSYETDLNTGRRLPSLEVAVHLGKITFGVG